MSLIVMAVYDTDANQRTKYTKQTLMSLYKTVDFDKHRLIISDNGSCNETRALYENLKGLFPYTVIYNGKNLGTAEGVNQGIRERKQEEFVIKIDNDVRVNEQGWIEKMEAVFKKEPKAGIVGLKRKDLAQTPNSDNPWYKTTLVMLPHEPGEKWIVVEKSEDIMGTCTMFSPHFLDTVGYMRQSGVYGFDDSIFSKISLMTGFNNYLMPTIDIDHIDTGENPYQKEKERISSEVWPKYHALLDGYRNKKIPIYYNPFK